MSSYKLGYLKFETAARLKQGLASQELASQCFQCLYDRDRARATALAKKSVVGEVIGPLESKNMFYPIYNPPVSYGLPKIPDDCPCLRYIRPA